MPRFIGDSLQRGVGIGLPREEEEEKQKYEFPLELQNWASLHFCLLNSCLISSTCSETSIGLGATSHRQASADMMRDSPKQSYFMKVGQLRKSKQIMMVLEGALMMKLCKLKARLMTTQIQMSVCQVNSMTICSPQVDTLIYSLSVQPSFRTFRNLSQSFSENNNLLVLAKILIP